MFSSRNITEVQKGEIALLAVLASQPSAWAAEYGRKSFADVIGEKYGVEVLIDMGISVDDAVDTTARNFAHLGGVHGKSVVYGRSLKGYNRQPAKKAVVHALRKKSTDGKVTTIGLKETARGVVTIGGAKAVRRQLHPSTRKRTVFYRDGKITVKNIPGEPAEMVQVSPIQKDGTYTVKVFYERWFDGKPVEPQAWNLHSCERKRVPRNAEIK
jgi:hypothetical protein